MTTTLEDLERRVKALERAHGDTTETLRWTVAKLGQMSAVQDQHTLRLDRIEGKLDRIEHKLDGLLDALPEIIARAVRDAKP
jgi:hypothetical protein